MKNFRGNRYATRAKVTIWYSECPARAELSLAAARLDLSRMPTFACALLGALLAASAAIAVGFRVKLRSLSAALAKAQLLLAQNLERLDLALEGADEALWD